MSGVTITAVEDPNPEDVGRVIRGLVGFNVEQVGSENWRRLAVFARDASGDIVGGAVGETHWNWVFVSHLWLSEPFRGQRVGGEMMSNLEELGVESGCNAIHLDTYDFQALEFYEHLGYQSFGELADCPTGHTRHFLWKPLGDL